MKPHYHNSDPEMRAIAKRKMRRWRDNPFDILTQSATELCYILDGEKSFIIHFHNNGLDNEQFLDLHGRPFIYKSRSQL